MRKKVSSSQAHLPAPLPAPEHPSRSTSNSSLPFHFSVFAASCSFEGNSQGRLSGGTSAADTLLAQALLDQHLTLWGARRCERGIC